MSAKADKGGPPPSVGGTRFARDGGILRPKTDSREGCGSPVETSKRSLEEPTEPAGEKCPYGMSKTTRQS